jgi:putative transposase
MDVPVGETPILRSQSMSYTSGSHTVFHHRYHIVWITKYRYKVLEGALRERIRTIIRQVCKELGVQIVSGVLSREHVHMFVEIPPQMRSATSCGASRDAHRIGCRWSSRTCASATGGGNSGLGATSPSQAATSRTMSYFSIFRSTNLPASAGSYSVQDSR